MSLKPILKSHAQPLQSISSFSSPVPLSHAVTSQLLFYYFLVDFNMFGVFYMKMLNYGNISVLLFDIYFII